MKFSVAPRCRKGFTLVELLVVITIIVALAGVAFVTAQKAMNTARERQSQKDCADLALSINNFISEHQGVLPVDALADLSEDKAISTDVDDPANMISILMDRERGSEQDHVNRTGKKYVSAQIVDERRGGLYIEGRQMGLYDPWGKPYYVILDVNGDEEIKDPTAKKNQDKPIFSRVIVYGTGLDGAGSQKDHKIQDPEYNADNIYSWKKK
jgi:prepilin-type N-terminal cleavage/methylation domain-containing protein